MKYSESEYFRKYSNTNMNTLLFSTKYSNTNTNTVKLVFEYFRIRIPNTNTPCLHDTAHYIKSEQNDYIMKQNSLLDKELI